jgi:glycosyltransferase involved in cell wall biosynthesis
MRILHLTPDPPSPRHINGGATRQYHLFRRLIELGHEVTVVAPFEGSVAGDVEALRAEGFAVHPVYRPASRIAELLSALMRRPGLLAAPFRLSLNGLVGAVYWARLKPVVLGLLKEESFDVVNIEQEFASQWIADIPARLPRVLTSHQVESAYRFDRAERRSGLARTIGRIDARRSARSEARWTPEFDAVVCMSEAEIERLRETVSAMPAAEAIGNGADLAWLSELADDPDELRVLFTGTMSFEPNAIAAEFLAREVMPLVTAELPGATLNIVGRDPGPATLALNEIAGVTVHGSVPDMRPFFASASLCTLPMLEGGGTRLKLAEAFAAERAVVSTTNGAVGVPVTPGDDIVIADGAEAFARAIVELLRDDERRDALAAAGHRTGSEHLDWQKLGERWAGLLESVVAVRHGRGVGSGAE